MSQELSSLSNPKQQLQSNDITAETGDTTPTNEALEVIREEQNSQGTSVHMLASKATAQELKSDFSLKCACKKSEEAAVQEQKVNAVDIERLLQEKELELRTEYDKLFEKEMVLTKERFDFILLNEQTRASYMLREAYRERQEKITALKSQLECKNLAALMYVMCTERRRSRLEKLRIIQDYTNYIHGLQDILSEGQELILHLSRGYKTAARVDHEWREKMKKVIIQFLSFIYHFAGGNPETNQYLLDLPALLKTEAPLVDNPDEDPCESEVGEEEEEDTTSSVELPRNEHWWEQLDQENHPFVLFGDMTDFKPPQRRKVLKHVKAAKTAPKKWKHYVFNDMFLNASCTNLDTIKDQYPKRTGIPERWECQSLAAPVGENNKEMKVNSRQSLNIASRRMTGQSIDIRGNMGSLLKIIVTANLPSSQSANTKTALLGARDSMEITSTTKLRERTSIKPPAPVPEEPKEVVLAIGRRRTSLFDQARTFEIEEEAGPEPIMLLEENQEEDVVVDSPLGSIHNDSLQMLQTQTHIPEIDHKIVYERTCPMEKCQRLQVDSFMRSLPPYMRASPFMHFEQTFEEYETCTPEQLEILKQRLESKKHKSTLKTDEDVESPLTEWCGRGVAVQTSQLSLSLPPCTCHVPTPTPVSSNFVFNFQDLIPVKQAMDAIHKECLYDSRIDFDRFKVVGQESKDKLTEEPKKEFKQARYSDIKKILKQHPSLLDLFQANTQC